MTRPAASCPGCGAPVEFRWRAAVQTTCPYCRSVLVRQDVDLQRVGVVADLPADSSPIQLGTEGRWRGVAFTVVGRIIYEYERGAWSEWHLVMADGGSAWLSDAQLDYAISRLETADEPLPPSFGLVPGMKIGAGGRTLAISTITQARYRGVEGELPFEYWDKTGIRFADLAAPDGAFGTIDYSEEPPLLFLGEWVRFADLGLTNVREFAGWPLP